MQTFDLYSRELILENRPLLAGILLGTIALSTTVVAKLLQISPEQAKQEIQTSPEKVLQKIEQIPDNRVQHLVKQVNPEQVKLKIDINKICTIESSNNPKAVNKRTKARGLCQLMEPTWNEAMSMMKKSWTWDDAFDGNKNKEVGNWYINVRIPGMLKYYKIPDTTETRLSAYNWGIGNVKKTWERYKDDWQEHLPEETKNYIEKYYNL